MKPRQDSQHSEQLYHRYLAKNYCYLKNMFSLHNNQQVTATMKFILQFTRQYFLSSYNIACNLLLLHRVIYVGECSILSIKNAFFYCGLLFSQQQVCFNKLERRLDHIILIFTNMVEDDILSYRHRKTSDVSNTKEIGISLL